jgi:outer membrane protein OmpA-like peptidoglycan-associated protein
VGEARSKKHILVAFVWVFIAGALAVGYKFFVAPAKKAEVVSATGSQSRYRHEVKLAIDGFSGYAAFRSRDFRDDLGSSGILLQLKDDGADYAARIRALSSGKADMALFTVDSLITASAALGEFPASIVLVVDETRGADAIVVRDKGPKDLAGLNHPEARFVLTPSSPSEFLARVVRAHFRLSDLPKKDWFISKDGPEEVLKQFRVTSSGEKRAFVLWEPYVSMALAAGGRKLLDSSKLKGLIVDVLVARRSFLQEKPDVVRKVVEAYLRASWSWKRKSGGMAELILEDSREQGSPLDATQAKTLAQGILWKNTLENFAHFGLVDKKQARGVQHLEDIIVGNVMPVLLRTGALDQDPLEGKANILYYDRILSQLKQANFHPGKLPGVELGGGEDLASIREDGDLSPLSDSEWERLIPVGDVQVASLSFGRGTARLNIRSERELTRLAGILSSWPSYYLVVTGHARSDGDPEANKRLALERAQAAADFLRTQGLAPQRYRARAATPSGRGGRAQSVRFQLGQRPY